jgi:hypothetical protein
MQKFILNNLILFAYFCHLPKPTLKISGAGLDDTVTIGDQYGYRLIAISDIKRSGYSGLKITKQAFARSQSCDPTVRAAWPNVGGASWKR